MPVSIATARTATAGTVRAAYTAPRAKGAFVSIKWGSEVKTAAKHGVTRHKETTAVVRTGVEYANLGQNEGAETGALPWGQWATAADGTSLYPWIIEHKGMDYIRVYADVDHFVNGERVSLDEFLAAESANIARKDAIESGVDPETLDPEFELRSAMRNVKSTYFVDGVEVDRDAFLSYDSESVRAKAKDYIRVSTVTLSPRADSVLSIGGQTF